MRRTGVAPGVRSGRRTVARRAIEEAREVSERAGVDAGPPVTLGAGLRRWFLEPPRPHGEVIEPMAERYGLFIIIVLGEVVVGVVDGLRAVEDLDFRTVATGRSRAPY